ncbi:MAG TPA: hypothetical protein VFD38_16860 [Myxococcaceae bacterium]|nr:hypothetical protein [Myxococcaceae bacterium]
MNRAPSPVLSAVLAGALGLTACAAGVLSTAARDNLAKSASCPADQVKVEELGDSRYRATGCGKSETYVCKAAEHAVVSCIPESSVAPLPDQPAQAR